jgi:hypothetical protein
MLKDKIGSDKLSKNKRFLSCLEKTLPEKQELILQG